MWLETHEERRALAELGDMCETMNLKLFVWSISSGIRRRLTGAERATNKNSSQYESIAPEAGPDELIEAVLAQPKGSDGSDVRALYVLAEIDELINEDVVLRRKFREFIEDARARQGRHVLVMTPRTNNIPTSLDRTVTQVTLPVPTRDQHAQRIDRFVTQFKGRKKGDKLVNLSAKQRERLINAATGLTRDGLDRAVSVALTEFKCLDERAIETVAKEKRQLVDGTGFLQYTEPAETLDDVGGQDLFKAWLQQRMKAFGPEARAYGLPEPKGVLVTGPPGVGKSLGAKAASATWGRPLLRLDIGALMGGIVGESEGNTRQAIELIEAMAPCVLWIDEIEKGLSGMASSGSTDGGTTARVFQTLLTWLNEKTSSVFVFATANDPTSLPPELLRKGRLDEIFAVTLPSHVERVEVLEIHINRRKRNPKDFDLELLAANTKGFSGAELEQGVIDAMFAAFADDGAVLSTKYVLDAVQATKPMSETMAERIEAMALWAETRARPCSSLTGQEPVIQSAPTTPAEQKQAASDDILDILTD